MSRASFLTILLGLSLGSAACGLDGVVGGVCKAGYVESAGQCIPAPPSSSGSSTGGPATTTTTTNPTEDPNDHKTTSTPLSSFTPTDSFEWQPSGLATAPIIEPPPPVVEPPPPVVETITCEVPLVLCHGDCIPVDSDPRNCGACGRICPSNICSAGVCVGATPGDAVLIGHDMYYGWTGSVQARVLANAISIPTTDPIRVLAYERGAYPNEAAYTRVIITNSVSRTVVFTDVNDEAMLESQGLYASYDVVLIQGAGDDPAANGTRWSNALKTFTKRGGVVVALDNGTMDIPALVNATGIIGISGHDGLSDQTHFVVSGASDVVGQKLLSPYASFGASVGFLGVDPPSADMTWVVVTDADVSVPTVVHKVVR